MPLSESATRATLIDPQLAAAAWRLNDRTQARREIPVDGYDAEPWNGVTDYCLYDASGNVLAVVEAKRCSRNPREADEQLRHYVTQIAGRQPFAPFGFMANGRSIWFWEVGEANPRPVARFFTPDDLQRLLFLRQNRRPLEATPIDPAIVERPYQHEANRLHRPASTRWATCWATCATSPSGTPTPRLPYSATGRRRDSTVKFRLPRLSVATGNVCNASLDSRHSAPLPSQTWGTELTLSSCRRIVGLLVRSQPARLSVAAAEGLELAEAAARLTAAQAPRKETNVADDPTTTDPNRELLQRALLGEVELTPEQQRDVLGVDLSQAVPVAHPEAAALAAWAAIEVVGGKFPPGWEGMREGARFWRVPVEGGGNEWLPVIEHYMRHLFGEPIAEGQLIGYLNQVHHLSPAEAKELRLAKLAGLLKDDVARATQAPAEAPLVQGQATADSPQPNLTPAVSSAAEPARAEDAPADADPAVTIDLEAQGLALLFQHPDWSVPQIADHLKVNRKTPYKWKKFRNAAESQGKLKPRGPKDRKLRRGHKTRDGQVEAYADEDE
ncbi:MAG TPA: hypothetical protein VGF55_23330 [Gemmataceae bacterium]|jgi:hypothetical protein